MKRILYTFIAAMLVLCGCSAKADKDAFTYENLTLYLDKEESFQEDTAQGYDYCLLGDTVIIFARRISKQELSGMGLTDTDSVFRYGFGDEQEYEEIRGYRTFLYFGSSANTSEYRYLYALLEDSEYYWDFNVCSQVYDDSTDAKLKEIIRTLKLK